jgi:CheY-like chemotaxis protein
VFYCLVLFFDATRSDVAQKLQIDFFSYHDSMAASIAMWRRFCGLSQNNTRNKHYTYPKELWHDFLVINVYIQKHITKMEDRFFFKKVMVVDDDNMDRLLITTLLKKRLFAEEIIAVDSVFAALTYLQSLKRSNEAFPSVIFLDLNLPEMDGFDFLDNFMMFPEELQQQSMIVVQSSTSSPDDLLRIHNYPVVKKFFRKPIMSEKLIEIQCLFVERVAEKS